jgi:hypothetical protein
LYLHFFKHCDTKKYYASPDGYFAADHQSMINFALFSNQANLINKLKLPFMTDLKMGGKQRTIIAPVSMAMSSILANDFESCELYINELTGEKYRRYRYFPAYQGYATAFRGLIHGDEEMIKVGVMNLLQTQKKRQEHGLFEHDIYSVNPLGVLKLAWSMGYTIQVEHDLIPQSLLPIDPEMKCELYSFLNPGWLLQ